MTSTARSLHSTRCIRHFQRPKSLRKYFLIDCINLVSIYPYFYSELLYSYFLSYSSSFKNAHSIIGKPLEDLASEGVQRRLSSSSQRSSRSKKRFSFPPSSNSRIVDIHQFVKKRSPYPIWLEPCKEATSYECVCVWTEEGMKFTKDHHFEASGYLCCCQCCSEWQERNPVEDLTRFLDFIIAIVLSHRSNSHFLSTANDTMDASVRLAPSHSIQLGRYGMDC